GNTPLARALAGPRRSQNPGPDCGGQSQAPENSRIPSRARSHLVLWQRNLPCSTCLHVVPDRCKSPRAGPPVPGLPSFAATRLENSLGTPRCTAVGKRTLFDLARDEPHGFVAVHAGKSKQRTMK